VRLTVTDHQYHVVASCALRRETNRAGHERPWTVVASL
jgi:hypothetical protein